MIVRRVLASHSTCALADINHAERSARSGQLLVALLPSSGRLVTLDADAAKLSAEQLEPLMTLAQQGCLRLHAAVRDAVAAHAQTQRQARGVISY